jgi:integrase
MPRRVRDSNLESRTGRSRLKPRGKPYWRLMQEGLHIGYRKPQSGAGRWVVREYDGKDYETDTIPGFADDYADADGAEILNFGQAQDYVRHIAGRSTAASKSLQTVADAMAYYLKVRHTPDAENRVQRLILPELGAIKIGDLTTERLRDWHLALAKRKPWVRTKRGEDQKHRDRETDDESKRQRRASANRSLTIVKAALNFCWHDGLISSNEAWRRVKPLKGAEAARVRYLQKDEVRRLVNAANAELRPLIQAALLTGCRYGELSRLTADDYNADAGTVTIRQSKVAKARHVVLNGEGIKFFESITAGLSGNALLFMHNGQRWKKSASDRPMRAACKKASIEPHISINGMRHTYSSLAVMNGTELLVLARNLGHRDGRMVERHYGHLSDSYLQQEIRNKVPTLGIVGKTNLRRFR